MSFFININKEDNLILERFSEKRKKKLIYCLNFSLHYEFIYVIKRMNFHLNIVNYTFMITFLIKNTFQHAK